jgi:oxygen-dependent protoporphyrinogen oxidase
VNKVVIIGGGIAGLAAANALDDKKDIVEYTLVEKDNRLGGKIITEIKDGFLFEGGPDCFLSEKPSVIRLTQKLGLESSLLGTNEKSKGTYVFSGDKLHALPEGLMLLVPTKIIPFALSPLVSWPGKLRMGLDFILPRRKSDDDETLESFVLRRLGREALNKIAEPLIGGIHGGDPQTMSLKASFPRFLDMEKKNRSLIVAMLAARKYASRNKPRKQNLPDNIPKTYFMTFKKGMGELVEALETNLKGRILRGRAVTKVEKKENKYFVHIEKSEVLEADALILALPAPDAAELMRPLDADIARILDLIPMASSATINVAYPRKAIPGPLNSFGFLIPYVEQRKINAVTYSSVKWDYRVPDKDYVLFRTFVGGAKNSHLARESEETILQWIKDEFKHILGITMNPVMASVYRWLDARPQYTLGHLDRMETIEQRLANLTGIYLAGGSYRGIGVPDCIKDGIKAAEDALQFLYHDTPAKSNIF